MDIWQVPAVITGAASGLGAETAHHLAEAGARITLIDIDGPGLERVVARTGGLMFACDVSDPAATEEALARAREAHGTARIIVHCVGRAHPQRIIGDEGPLAMEDFRRLVDVNLISTFNILRLGAYDMTRQQPLREGERGVIIFTASVSAYEGQSGEAAYAASKGGVVSMILPAARELGAFGIRVVGIAPGLFSTPTLFQMERDLSARLASAIPYPPRFGDPAEFAMLVQHVIQNVMINGSVLRLDGGYHR